MPLSDPNQNIGAPRFELGRTPAGEHRSNPETPASTGETGQPGGLAWNDLNTPAGTSDGRVADAHPCCAVTPTGAPCPHKAGPVGRFLWLCWRHERRLASEMFEVMLRELREDSGWVYFAVHADRWGLVKIGYTTSIRKRMADLQTRPVVVIPYACRTTEAELHKRFAEYRVDGEWFRAKGKLEAYIQEQMNIQDGWAR